MSVSSQYPKDEFDRAGEDMPVGMHRPQPSKWKAVIPFLLILVLVPLLGWGANHLLTSRGVVSGSESDTTTSQSSSSDVVQSGTEASASAEPSESATQETSPTEESTPQASPSTEASTSSVDYGVAISVLNGTGTSGLAAEKAAQLNTAGFPGTTAANATGWSTTVTTVYYRDPDLEATAQAIAQTLGISNTVLNTTDLGSSDVVVVLK